MKVSHTVQMIALSLLLVAGGSACTPPEKEEKAPQTMRVSPNDDSELALLMRAMYPDAEEVRTHIVKGSFPPDFREKFARLHDAVPTDSAVKTDLFASLGDSFLSSLDELYRTPTKEKFNIVVEACVACHKKYCTGPIPKIRKLEIGEEGR